MTRLLVAGVGPRPSSELRQVFAPGLRLDTIVRALEDAGHEVHTAEFTFGGGAATAAPDARATPLPPSVAEAVPVLNAAIERHRAQAVVALTDIGALAAASSSFTGPLFVDYFGHPMAERQMQGAVH
ncbi:hypothetical protein HZA57_09490 [Candidatus Poribacteria bacterium]|nr:hypothetical protein [Candidatus Poribacteria bacterium]